MDRQTSKAHNAAYRTAAQWTYQLLQFSRRIRISQTNYRLKQMRLYSFCYNGKLY